MPAPAWEFIDRRMLAALAFVDAAGRAVTTPVTITSPGIGVLVKRPGEVVVTKAPGLEAYAASFAAPPAAPAVGSISIPLDLRPADPAFAPRRFVLILPRDPDPVHAGDLSSLFRPVEVPLLPGPRATATGLLAALRVTVRRSTDGLAIEGALVRLRPEGGRPQARALTDPAGDALLLVPGVPMSSAGAGGMVLPDIAADLDAVVDANLVRFNAAATLDDARAAAAARLSNLIDPDDVESRLAGSATSPLSVRIAAGQTRTAAITWVPPP
jgi:hypothetical protein